MKQSEVESILAKVEASMEASHRAQVELLQAVRLLFIEKQAIPEHRTPLERDPDIELAALRMRFQLDGNTQVTLRVRGMLEQLTIVIPIAPGGFDLRGIFDREETGLR